MNEKLRLVTENDKELLLEWENDSKVRKDSFSMHEISSEEWSKWSYSILNNRNIYIFVVDGKDVGQVRLDVFGSKIGISYSIISDYRCMGYAKIMISLIISTAHKRYPGVLKLITKVKKDDIALKKAFIYNGFEEKDLVYEYDLTKEPVDRNKFGNNQKNQVRVLFLTNNAIALSLYEWLLEQNISVDICSDKITVGLVRNISPFLIISYNYSHIIKQDVIDESGDNIVNMHISFLPYNRGASPNLWSFLDETKKGVTIHKVDKGLDTGDIIYQKELSFDTETETFFTAYSKLHQEIIALFKYHWNQIWNRDYITKKQVGEGTCHTVRDYKQLKELISFSWDDKISDVMQRYQIAKDRSRNCEK